MADKREAPVENSLVSLYKRAKGRALKFVSPGWAGAMDRLCLAKIEDKEHRAIVAKYVTFIECKAPGKTLEKHQERRRKELRRLGYSVFMLDSTIPKHVTDLEVFRSAGVLL